MTPNQRRKKKLKHKNKGYVPKVKDSKEAVSDKVIKG